jgi:DNA-binding response OmpR family regulator
MSEISKGRDIVLVVDDSPETLNFLTDALEHSGATVLVAKEGARALALVERITPDIVLMDAVMPGMDGFETTRRLKANAALAHVPVIFMTGLSETEHILEGLEAGGVDYVTKPIVLDVLLARIRVHLANARTAQSARMALDTAGRYLLAANQEGEILWCTPQAVKLLEASHHPVARQREALAEAVARPARLALAAIADHRRGRPPTAAFLPRQYRRGRIPVPPDRRQ